MERRELNDLWFSFQPIPGIAFGLNDAVRIKSGEHAGEAASVISLETLEPTPVYVVELASSGAEVKVVESDIERAV